MAEIVWALSALLLALTGWLIITGRHQRYYSRLRRRHVVLQELRESEPKKDKLRHHRRP